MARLGPECRIGAAQCRTDANHHAANCAHIRASYLAAALALTTPALALTNNAGSQTKLAPVIVNGTRVEDNYDTAQPSLQKLTGPILDTPQSMTTVGRAELD